MEGSAAARLASMLRTAIKDQALSGADLAREIERLTGTCPSPMWVSRRVGTAGDVVPMIRVSDELFVIAEAIGLDHPQLAAAVLVSVFPHVSPDEVAQIAGQLPRCGVCGSFAKDVRGVEVAHGAGEYLSARCTSAWHDEGPRLAGGEPAPNPYQSARCEHPDVAGAGCQACCDDCNSDRHVCVRCGGLVGHGTAWCETCFAEDDDE